MRSEYGDGVFGRQRVRRWKRALTPELKKEIADGGNGTRVFVATVYSYVPQGNQIFLIMVGPAGGNMANVDVFITEDGVWGSGFDPDLVNTIPWGTGTFVADSCVRISMSLTSNGEHQAQGYSLLACDLVRLSTPLLDCPF